VRRTGKSELATEISEEQLAELAQDDFHRASSRELAFRATCASRCVAHAELLGVISLVAAESGRRYGRGDLAARRGARATRGHCGRERAALPRGRGSGTGGARVLETVGDGVFLVDTEGSSGSGTKRGDDLGHHARGGRRPPPRGVAAGLGARVDARGNDAVRCATAGERWVSISGVTFDEGVVYAFQDISDERALEQIRQDLVATVSARAAQRRSPRSTARQ
jgi:hypothetical protein